MTVASSALLMALAVAVGTLPPGWGGAGSAVATPLERPNIVLVLTDDQTMESVAKMPHVSSRNDWITFPNAYIENAMCCPSRATILSGRYDTHTRVTNNGATGNFDATQTMASWLQGAGYRTGLFGKYLNNYPRIAPQGLVPPGWTTFQALADGKTVYSQYNYDLVSDGVTEYFGYQPADYQVDVLTGRARQFIQDSGDEPFFLYFAPTATHGPWKASPRRVGMFTDAPVPHNAALFNEPDVSDKPSYILNHAQQNPTVMDTTRRRMWETAVSVDDAMAALDTQLEASGEADNTVVIFMTDNGNAFGEHRWIGKACQYRVCNQTPLLVRYPGQGKRSIPNMISNVDIASTVAAIAGVSPGGPQDGESFLPLIQGSTQWPDEVLHHWPGHIARDPDDANFVPQFWAIRTRQHLYVELSTGERELYVLRTDPNELRNVAGRPLQREVQAHLAARLAVLKAEALAP